MDFRRRGIAKAKALISFAFTAKLICAFVFAYANCWFSHAVAHIVVPFLSPNSPNTCHINNVFFNPQNEPRQILESNAWIRLVSVCVHVRPLSIRSSHNKCFRGKSLVKT